jgi:hypothetical protein
MRRVVAVIAVAVALLVVPSVFASSAGAQPTLANCWELAHAKNWFFGQGAGTGWSRDPYPWGGCVSTIQQHLNAADIYQRNHGLRRWFQIEIDGIFGNQTTWAMHAYERFVLRHSVTDGAAGAGDLLDMYIFCRNHFRNSGCPK